MKPSKFDLDNIESLEATIRLICNIDDALLPMFLQKIIEKSKLKEKISFGLEEEKKLISGLCLNSGEELYSICKLLELIFQQAIYHIMSTSLFKNELSHIGFSDGSIVVLAEAWAQSRRDLLQLARETSLAENQLTSVDWSLNLVTAKSSSSIASGVKPSAVFDLGIASNEPTKGTEILSMEFDHKRLYDFYQQLEAIQRQLDSLTS